MEKALKLLDQGDVVGMPTETVYGLAARIDRPEGLQKIFKIKERPFFDPLIVHVSSIEQAKSCASAWPEIAQALAEKFWPGPLTLVLPKSAQISSLITSGLTTVGIRFPKHPLAQELIQKAGHPLAAPSANLFGRTSPTRAEHVKSEFKNQVLVLDGGACEVGIESTIVAVDWDQLRILRPGQITQAEIFEFLRSKNLSFHWREPLAKAQAPGQMAHHYMPEKPLVLLTQSLTKEALQSEVAKRLVELPDEVEGVRILKPRQIENIYEVKLSPDPTLAARELYQKLRESAGSNADLLTMVWPVEKESGPWLALWDRLRKAASLRIT